MTKSATCCKSDSFRRAAACQGPTRCEPVALRTAEHARAIKSEDEIWCILGSIAVAETGIGRMRAALAPGMTENELFAILHHTNIAMGGEWCEYRLLASGGRTNPWGQECSDKMIRAGELVAFAIWVGAAAMGMRPLAML